MQINTTMYCIIVSITHIFALQYSTMSDQSIEKIKSQMRKGTLEYCVLAVISEKESYPSEIINQLKEKNLIVIEGTLYPLLTRLKNSDYLSYRWEESTGGPPRKYFSITEKGKQVLSELHTAWEEYSRSVNSITKNIK